MYDIEYKGLTGREHGILIMDRPAIPTPQEEVETFQVAGRDGVLTGERYLNPVEIPVMFNFRERPSRWAERFRKIRRWLEGSGELIFSDDRDYYRKVLSVQISGEERELKKIGRFEAEFTVDPYLYRVDGKEEYAISDRRILNNEYEESHPIWILTGSGSQTLTVNGNTATITVQGTTLIDTDRMITYTLSDMTLRNTRLTGDYEDLYLVPGVNTISASGSGTKVIPNWRCR